MIKIFISYAHEDEKYKDELEKHLKPLQRKGVIDSWNDREIVPGKEWDDRIKVEIENANVILFMISPDFIASDYIHDIEIKNALDRYNKKEVTIIPIIIRPTDFSYLEISKFQALPKDGKPITSWGNVDEAWHDVSVQLRKVFTSFNSRKNNQTNTNNQNPNSNSSTSNNATQNSVDQSKIKIEIQNLVAKSKLDKAIDKLMEYANNTNDGDLQNSVVLLSARYSSLKKNVLQGLLTNSEESIQRAKITNSILGLKDDI